MSAGKKFGRAVRRASPWLGLLAAAALSPVSDARAQQPDQLVDRIVAVVGDTIILRSEVEDYILELQHGQGVDVPPPDSPQRAAFTRQVLERMVADVLIVVAAEKADIVVGDDEVAQVVDQQIASVRRRFPTQAQFEAALATQGMSLAEYRMHITQRARAQLMARRYLEQEAPDAHPSPVSDEEIEAVWEAQKATLGAKPASVTLKQVIISTKPSEKEQLAAKQRADSALARARSGEDFARLAREYSDDPGTRDNGGDLGWQQKGNLVKPFEDALWSMSPGQISDVIETPYGYHIIKLERVRGNDRQARHILIRPQINAADEARARALADSVAEQLRAGADIDSLITRYGDPSERATLTQFPQDQLPDYYKLALQGGLPGDIVGPIELNSPNMPAKFSVVDLLDLSPAGEWTLDEYRDVIRQQLQQQKTIEKVIDKLRDKTYVEIRLGDSSVSG